MEREMTTVGGLAPASREALAVDSAHARRPGVPMEAEPHADPGASGKRHLQRIDGRIHRVVIPSSKMPANVYVGRTR